MLDFGNAGLLVPPSDPCALAEALVSFLADEERKTRLAHRFRTGVVDRYIEAGALERFSAAYDASVRGL